MVIKKVLFCAAALCVGFSLPKVLAQSDNDINYNIHRGAYLGGSLGAGWGLFNNEQDQFSSQFQGLGYSAYLGYQLNPYFGVEADFTGINALGLGLGLYIYGASLKGILPFKQRFALYGKLGVGGVSVDACDTFFNTGLCTSDSSVGGIVGLGLSVALTNALSLALDASGVVFSPANNTGFYGVLGLALQYNFDS